MKNHKDKGGTIVDRIQEILKIIKDMKKKPNGGGTNMKIGAKMWQSDGRGPSTSPHASPPKSRIGPTLELWPRGSKKTFFYMFKCHKL